ncbi:MAG TPA: CDP-diacylglycerol--serine O-phosphatidyltransferase [Thermoanaerobaculia bacterium]|jgi:CDP-diacylglycerol--serine O-phosphatidyltransferase|nr:CDP-diacylglycerol--serine O-phosphatidyltransferase [Thermoanaerobaculia bacterium]
MQRPDVRKNLRRGVYIVPTLFTMLNIFFGFRSIVHSMSAVEAITENRIDLATHAFEIACVSLLIAAVFDTFDGLIARQLGATSEFGKEYDSLADVVTFGCAPAVLVYAWGLHPLGKLGMGIAFLFLVSVSLRLARFNVMTGKSDYRYFVGLPSPAGALTIAAIIYYAPAPVLASDRRFAIVIMILTACTAFAMVSPIRWRAQKGINFQKGRSLMYIVVLATIIAIGWAWPRQFGLILAVTYLASGPMLRLWTIAFPSRKADDVLQIAPQ